MSWDIYAIRPEGELELMDLADDFQPVAFATREQIAEALLELVPSADVSDLSWMQVTIPEACIEVNVGEGRDVDGIMFHARSGELVVPIILSLCEKLGIQALDISEGRRLTADVGRESQRRWEEYREGVLGAPSPPTSRRWWRR